MDTIFPDIFCHHHIVTNKTKTINNTEITQHIIRKSNKCINAGFFIAKIDKIKKWLTLQLLQFELVLMIFRAMSSQLALYKMSLVPTWILTASGLLSVSDSMI